MGNRLLNGIASAIVAVVLAVGSVGCLISGFDLTVEQFPMIVMIAGLFALMGAIAFSYRYGIAVVLGISLMAALFFWQGGEAQTQTQALITHISYVYDQAYHWGVVRFPGGWFGVPSDLPMSIMASVIALATTWTVSRRHAAVFALVPALIPVVLCFVVTDTVPDAWCFFCVIVSLLFLFITSTSRKRDFERISSLTWVSAVSIVAAVGLLFAAVPQSSYRNPNESIQNQLLEALGFEGYGTGTGGEVEGVDLKGLGSRFFLQYPVMTVTSSQDGVLYLRERDFNVYNGISWESDEEREDALAVATGEAVYEVTVETKWLRRQLLMPYYVTESVRMTDGAAPNTKQTQSYSWQVEPLSEDWKEQIPNTAPDVLFAGYAIDPEFYHSLPVETQGWAQELLKTVLTDEKSATAIADTIAEYVQSLAFYEDDCQRMPSSKHDFAQWFIEDGESGYCVHFATSAAVLLRAAGVNTRYVTGYKTTVKANEETVITADLEHAWVEYYEPAIDRWVMLECTPPEPEELPETTTATVVTTTTMADDATTTTRPTQSTQPDEQPKVTIPWREILAVVWKGLLWVCGAVLVIALIEGQRHLRQARWQKRYDAATVNGRALMLWREIERMARSLGTTPSERSLTLAQKAKYSQHTLTDDELAHLTQEREDLMAVLRTHAAPIRFLYRYVWRYY